MLATRRFFETRASTPSATLGSDCIYQPKSFGLGFRHRVKEPAANAFRLMRVQYSHQPVSSYVFQEVPVDVLVRVPVFWSADVLVEPAAYANTTRFGLA